MSTHTLSMMAQQSLVQEEFSYTNIELFKGEMIGSGAYGAVCKARCDKLPCAAKLLYNTLLDVQDQASLGSGQSDRLSLERSHRTPMNRFKQECQFLSRVSHPNIVQYLGTYSDPDTHILVLLMEIMDESLTHFIENSPGAIPLCVQVDIGHDVILALDYLHSNNIIHRDLSSNNVLLTSSRRAKVSDFGMSTIIGNNDISNSLTLCPGNVSYMPPEALDQPPQYTNSLDIFSFGVLLVQVNSLLFPNPSNRFTAVDVISPISHKAVEAKLAVPEIKRRIQHIHMLDGSSPLLPIVLDCLRDVGQERPSASQLCDRFMAAKKAVEYAQSKETFKTCTEGGRSQKEDGEVNWEENIYELDDELPKSYQHFIEKIKQLEEANQHLQERVEETEQEDASSSQLLSIRSRELQRLNRLLSTKEEESLNSLNDSSLKEEQDMLKESELRYLNSTIEDMSRENIRLREQIHLQDATIADLQSIVDDREDYISSTKAHLLAEMEDNHKLRAQLDRRPTLSRDDSAAHESLDEWIKSPAKVDGVACDLEKKEKEVKDLKKFISIKDAHITVLQEQLQIMEAKLNKSTSSPTPNKPTVKPRSHLNIQVEWELGKKAPSLIQAGSTAVSGTMVYCRPANSGDIYEFSAKHMTWRLLENCPSNACTLVTIDNILTAVGGKNTSKLLSFVEDDEGVEKWEEIYPPMSMERFNTAAAYSNGLLIVAGGFGRGWSSVPDVEILNVTTHVWSPARTLPYPIYSATAAVCNNCVYVVGGYFEKARGHFSALACPMNNLTEEFNSHGDAEASLSWHKIADVPVCRSTCISFRGKLAVAGGRLVNGLHSSSVYLYNSNANNWTSVTDMLQARSECHVGVVNDKKIVVAGGYTVGGLTDDVEIGNIVMR